MGNCYRYYDRISHAHNYRASNNQQHRKQFCFFIPKAVLNGKEYTHANNLNPKNNDSRAHEINSSQLGNHLHFDTEYHTAIKINQKVEQILFLYEFPSVIRSGTKQRRCFRISTVPDREQGADQHTIDGVAFE